MSFKTAFYAILLVIVVHIVAMLIGLYGIWPSFDIPMHFAGGFVMGMLGIAIHSHMTDKQHFKKVADFYHVLFILGFVMLVAVGWEFHEYILDNTVVIWYGWPRTQLSLGDTILDLILGGIGGLIAAWVFKKNW